MRAWEMDFILFLGKHQAMVGPLRGRFMVASTTLRGSSFSKRGLGDEAAVSVAEVRICLAGILQASHTSTKQFEHATGTSRAADSDASARSMSRTIMQYEPVPHFGGQSASTKQQ
jgi:hypothetical protein